MPNIVLKELFKKYLDETMTPEEFSQLYEIIRAGYDPEDLDELLENVLSNPDSDLSFNDYDKNEVFASFLQKIDQRKAKEEIMAPVIPLYHNRRTAGAVAAIIFLLSVGIYLIAKRQNRPNQPVTEKKEVSFDALPASNGAILTLANGQQIELDSSHSGALAQQGNVRLLKQGGKLSYQMENRSSDNPTVLYNIITTPRGKQFRLVLADGTRVWLNASSSLHFPTAFTGKERRVSLTGEAYFEVVENKSMPFHVEAGDLKVLVLGTHFNVMAYNDDNAIKTTLLEGAIKISKGNNTALLRPGQQAATNNTTDVLDVKEADVDEAVAWKNGLFQFNSDDIATIMRQLGRWYDVETVYEGKMPGWHFTGSIGRNIPLSQVLKMLEVNDFRFRVEGKKIIVL